MGNEQLVVHNLWIRSVDLPFIIHAIPVYRVSVIDLYLIKNINQVEDGKEK